MSDQYPTAILGRPTRIHRGEIDGGPPAYVLRVVHDGHEHQWITHHDQSDEHHGARCTWVLAGLVPSGWLPIATGRAEDPEQAVRECAAWRTGDHPSPHHGACRLCGGTWAIIGHEPDEHDECPHCHAPLPQEVTA